jgi:hypothetical protein
MEINLGMVLDNYQYRYHDQDRDAMLTRITPADHQQCAYSAKPLLSHHQLTSPRLIHLHNINTGSYTRNVVATYTNKWLDRGMHGLLSDTSCTYLAHCGHSSETIIFLVCSI